MCNQTYTKGGDFVGSQLKIRLALKVSKEAQKDCTAIKGSLYNDQGQHSAEMGLNSTGEIGSILCISICSKFQEEKKTLSKLSDSQQAAYFRYGLEQHCSTNPQHNPQPLLCKNHSIRSLVHLNQF